MRRGAVEMLNDLKKKSLNIRQEIVKKINDFKKIETLRISINSEVKKSKQKRQDCVKGMKDIINELSELNNIKKSDAPKNVKSLVGLINKKEWFFQINALPIKKEEQILKEIKELKKELNAAKKENDAIKRIRVLVRMLEAKRKEHNEFHESVIKNADKSNELSSQMNEIQKEIKMLKKEGNGIKKEISKLVMHYKIEKEKKKNDLKDKKQEFSRMIEEKENQVFEKLKNKKKLTTEDLLVFQNN